MSDQKAGWCTSCRGGMHSMCAGCACPARPSLHPGRPKDAQRRPVVVMESAAQRRMASVDCGPEAAPVAGLPVPVLTRPYPVARWWHAYAGHFEHYADARWSFMTQFRAREGRHPHAAEVDEGVVKCPSTPCLVGGRPLEREGGR